MSAAAYWLFGPNDWHDKETNNVSDFFHSDSLSFSERRRPVDANFGNDIEDCWDCWIYLGSPTTNKHQPIAAKKFYIGWLVIFDCFLSRHLKGKISNRVFDHKSSLDSSYPSPNRSSFVAFKGLSQLL